MKLSNFIRQCSCGKGISFRDTEQKTICPICGQLVVLPSSIKQYLLTQNQIIQNKQIAGFSFN